MSLGWKILLRISLAGSPHNKLVLLTKEEEALDPVEIASLETVSLKVLTLSLLHELQQSSEDIKLMKSVDTPKNTSFDMIKMSDLEIFCEVCCNICCKIKSVKKLVNTGQFKVPDRHFSYCHG